MTIDEAIEHAEEVAKELGRYCQTPCADEHRQLAEWLRELKALKQEPCDDAISRRAALKLFATNDGKYLFEAIRDLPSVTPKQRTGHWERHYTRPNVYADLYWYCSACGDKCGYNDANLFEYCPHCGAKMESGDDK